MVGNRSAELGRVILVTQSTGVIAECSPEAYRALVANGLVPYIVSRDGHTLTVALRG